MNQRPRAAGYKAIALTAAVCLTACTSIGIQTDPDKAPSFASSILWLNDYFRTHNVDVRVAENRVHYAENRSGSHSGTAASYPWFMESKDVHFQYVNGSVLLLRRATVFSRFDVDDADRQPVIQRLVAAGLKFNQASRIRPFACVAGDEDRCPKYPDDGANRKVDPNSGPCWKRKCPSPI